MEIHSVEELAKLLQRKQQELYLIQHITEVLNKSIDLKTTLDSILLALQKLFGINHSMILLLNREKTKLVLFSSYGYEHRGEGAEVEIGQGVIGVVAKHRKIMNMKGLMRKRLVGRAQANIDANEIQLPGLENVDSQIAIPLVLNEELIGVISIESPEVSIFSKEDEELIKTMTNQMAASIQNAILYRDLEWLVKERTIEVMQQKEEIEAQRDELEKQRDLVGLQKKEMMDSITYSSRIQRAMLGSPEEIEMALGNAFIYFRPRSIVSGDFYWYGSRKSPFVMDNNEDIKIIIAADCTGHGVPGAFMTAMAHSLLNEIVEEEKIINPAKILCRLDEKIASITKRGTSEGVNDGMDIAILLFDMTNRKIYFSAAKNPLYYVRNGLIEQIKGSRAPIGGGDIYKNKEFALHKMDMQEGDMFYIFSDGFQDQASGIDNRKYMTKNYREFLQSISHFSVLEQKEKIDAELLAWKGNGEQTDDILIIGVKI